MSNRRLLWALFAFAVIAGQAAADGLAAIRDKGSIRIAVYNDFPPYSAAGKGLDVDLGRALAAKLGLKPDIMWFNADENMDDDLRNMVWKGHYLGGGTAHVMMHVPVDPVLMEHNDKVRIFAPYHREQLAIARNTARIPNFMGMAGLEAFTREKVGVETATLADDFLMGVMGGRLRENVVHFKSVPQAAEALRQGAVSAVMAPRAELEGALRGASSQTVIQGFEPRGIAITAWDVGLAVKADEPELAEALNAAMEALRADGTLERIFREHGVTLISPANR